MMGNFSEDPKGCMVFLLFVVGCLLLITIPGFLICYFALGMDWSVALLIGFLTGQFALGLLEILPVPFKLIKKFRQFAARKSQ
jgi:hypothetical protein